MSIHGPVTSATLDAREVERFARISDEWWDPRGKFRPLHAIGPARVRFLRDEIAARRGRDPSGARPLAGLTVLDVGCGGGLTAEPLCRLGGAVTGIDPAPENIAVARRHAELAGLGIDYRATTAEALAAEAAVFDAVVCLEVIEHVPSPAAFVATLGRLLAPGGILVLSTLNRTVKSFALAIVGAEYVLGWLPRGSHRWDRFLTPEELEGHLQAAGLAATAIRGITYDVLTDRWSLSADTSVNYLMAAARPR